MDIWIWSFICLIVTFIIVKAYKQVHYFSKWGIPQPPQLPFIGVMFKLFYPRRHINDFVKYIYNLNKEAKYMGFNVFLSRTIFIRDLDLVKSVLVKDFDYFADRKTFVDEATDPLFGKNLNFLNGDRWREVRNMLSPAFTSSKMRAMYVLMSQCAQNFASELIKQYENAECIDIKDVFGRYTNDVIASCAFGIEVNSLDNPMNEFYLRAKESTNFEGITMLKLMLEMMFPTLTRKMGLRIISKKETDFFINVIETTIKARQDKGIIRPDMLQLMMEARSKMTEEASAKFDSLEMTAQAFFFFLAGYDASSTQTCIIAHELAVNPDIQEKVQAEIDAIMETNNGQPTYEAINFNMPYLDAVFSESLRRHPIAFLNRVCSKEFELPPALPGSKPYKVTPGTNIMIPVAGIHADSDLYEDPEKFNPERFIHKKVTISDSTNLGFGLGPRMCMGNRFAILQIKAVLVHLLAKCNLVPCKKTCIPMEYRKSTFAPVPKNGFWLKLKMRHKLND